MAAILHCIENAGRDRELGSQRRCILNLHRLKLALAEEVGIPDLLAPIFHELMAHWADEELRTEEFIHLD